MIMKNWDTREHKFERHMYSRERYAGKADISPILKLEILRERFEGAVPDNQDEFMQLGAELCDLLEVVLRNEWAVESSEPEKMSESNIEDNFSLSIEGVKKIILEDVRPGQVFYPSDVADKHGLDLRTVVEAVNELKEGGQVSEK